MMRFSKVGQLSSEKFELVSYPLKVGQLSINFFELVSCPLKLVSCPVSSCPAPSDDKYLIFGVIPHFPVFASVQN